MSNTKLFFNAPANHVLILDLDDRKKDVHGGESFMCPEGRVEAVLASNRLVVHGSGPDKGENDVVQEAPAGPSMAERIAAEAEAAKQDEVAEDTSSKTHTSRTETSAHKGDSDH